MAPTQSHISSFEDKRSETAASSKTSVSSSVNTETESSSNFSVSGNHTSTLNKVNDMDGTLPITSRGSLHHDSFFEDFHREFDSAVRNLEDLQDSKSFLDSDLLCYRRRPDLDLSEENQAVSVTQDHTAHKVAIDVRNFVGGDVKVKAVDDNELVVEGNIEKQHGGSATKKSFRRRFFFPGLVRDDNVFASMSADGVLTISVAKKDDSSNKKETKNIHITTSNEGAEIMKNTVKATNNTQQKNDTHMESLSKENTNESQFNQKQNESSQLLKDIPHDLPFLLPISTKGLFFHDSFFEDSRKQFETAVDRILRESGERDSTSDKMNLYRNLRKNKLQEETQAVSSTEDHHSHKIVVDVQDFKEGDVKVEVVSENELVVKGEVEMRQGNAVSRKSFLRRFFLPGLVSKETVSSVMSSDGVLTVTVQKTASKSQLAYKKETPNESSTIEQNSVLQNVLTNAEGKQTSQVETNSVAKSFTSKSQKSSAERTSNHMNSIQSTESNQSLSSLGKVSENGTTLSHDFASHEDFLSGDKFLPITPKGLFFNDSFFEDVRKDFEAAVSDVLSRRGVVQTVDDELSCYRSLREKDLEDETQAMRTTEDHNEYKVVLDVSDFKCENIKVKVEDEAEVVVEGQVERTDGTFSSTRSFSRRFNFPAKVDMKAIASAMSADGVLTITVPKVVQKGEGNN